MLESNSSDGRAARPVARLASQPRSPLRGVLVVLFGGLVAALATAYAACGREGYLADFGDQDVHLTILHTTDIHSRIVPYKLDPMRTDVTLGLVPGRGPYGGIARIATIIKRERKKASRVIHLDSGDLFQGAPIFNVHKGEAEIRALSTISPDAFVIGNHEFDSGALNLATQLQRWATFPILAANYDFIPSAKKAAGMLARVTRPYVIIDVQGLKVGVIGLANTSSMTSIGEGGNSVGIQPIEHNQVAQAYINMLQGKVHLVIVLSHLGLTEDAHLIDGYYRHERSKDGTSQPVRVPGLRGVDLILGGHHHVVLRQPKILNDSDQREVLMVHSGAFAKYVGRLDVVLRRKAPAKAQYANMEVNAYRYQIVPVDNTVPPDPAMQRLMEKYVLEMNRKENLTRVFAYAPELVPRFGRGTGDSSLGNLLAKALKDRPRVEADFAVTNSLGIRSDLQAGPVNVEAFYEIFPFENTVTTLFLSGREVQEMYDFITERSSGRGCASQAQIAGSSFIMNCRTHKAEAVCIGSALREPCKPGQKAGCYDSIARTGPTSCRYGSPINPYSSYKLAANDYIARGGSGFKVLQRNTTQFNTGISLRQALIEFLEKLPSCRQVNDRRARAGKKKYIVPAKYADLPCVVSSEDGRIRRRLEE